MSDFKVLVPLDGSRAAEHSLVYLDALRPVGDLEVELLAVVDLWMEAGTLSPEEVESREYNLLSTYLREVSSDIKKHSGLVVQPKVLRGSPASVIIKEATETKPDLIIISSHGHSGIARWRLGSVADKVIRSAPGDVLVIGPKATDKEPWIEALAEKPFRSILVPLDGSALGEAALEKALRLASAFDSTVHLVRAVQVPMSVEGYANQVTYVPNLLAGIVEGANAYLEGVVAKTVGLKKATTSVIVGPAASALEDYIEDNDIDLVIMTSHGRSGFIRTALGSVTDRLMVSGKAPVLIVRSQES